MKRLILAAFMLPALASTPEQLAAKAARAEIHANILRNRAYRKFQDRANEFLLTWQADCKAQGKILVRNTQDEFLSCQPVPPTPAPQAAPAPPPAQTAPPPTPAKKDGGLT